VPTTQTLDHGVNTRKRPRSRRARRCRACESQLFVSPSWPTVPGERGSAVREAATDEHHATRHRYGAASSISRGSAAAPARRSKPLRRSRRERLTSPPLALHRLRVITLVHIPLLDDLAVEVLPERSTSRRGRRGRRSVRPSSTTISSATRIVDRRSPRTGYWSNTGPKAHVCPESHAPLSSTELSEQACMTCQQSF